MKYGIFLASCCLIPNLCLASIESVSVIGSSDPVFNNSFLKNASQLAVSLVNQKKTVLCSNEGTGVSGAFLKTLSDRKGSFSAVGYNEKDKTNCPKNHPCQTINDQKVSSIEAQIDYFLSYGDGIVFLPGSFDVLYAFNYLQTLSKQEIMVYKPVVFLNTNHYWDRLKEMLIEMKRQNVISQSILDTIAFENKPDSVVKTLEKLEKTIQKLNKDKKL
ncbi:MAG: LOG family protein [Alphaproteobacteria bacterium]|nr:LOG family protein [Alphaproteobacteria bacterium]